VTDRSLSVALQSYKDIRSLSVALQSYKDVRLRPPEILDVFRSKKFVLLAAGIKTTRYEKGTRQSGYQEKE